MFRGVSPVRAGRRYVISIEAVPKLQFWNSNSGFKEKSGL
jgi:hypothetical protein